jgi:hypothetical protein
VSDPRPDDPAADAYALGVSAERRRVVALLNGWADGLDAKCQAGPVGPGVSDERGSLVAAWRLQAAAYRAAATRIQGPRR